MSPHSIKEGGENGSGNGAENDKQDSGRTYMLFEERAFLFQQMERLCVEKLGGKVLRHDGDPSTLSAPQTQPNLTLLISLDHPPFADSLRRHATLKNNSAKTNSAKGIPHVVGFSTGFLPLDIVFFVNVGLRSLCDLRDSEESVLEVLRVHARGGDLMTPSARLTLSQGISSFSNSISLRELEIGRLFARGFSAKEVAAATDLSIFTCKNHLRKVYKKLGISRVSQLGGALLR